MNKSEHCGVCQHTLEQHEEDGWICDCPSCPWKNTYADVPIKDLVTNPPRDLLSWSVFNLMVDSAPKDFLERFGIDASNHENSVRVELKINGVTVSPKAVFVELERQFEELVKTRAMKLVVEKCGESSKAADLLSEINEFAKRRAAEALGVNWEDRW